MSSPTMGSSWALRASRVVGAEGSIEETGLSSGRREKRQSLAPVVSLHPLSRMYLLFLDAHELPSVGSLVCYLHTAAGFPVKSTWLAAIKAGNFSTWPGLTYTNASRYCPTSEETIKGHLTQSKQGFLSTKTCPLSLPTPPAANRNKHPKSIKKLHLWVKHISTLFDGLGMFVSVGSRQDGE